MLYFFFSLKWFIFEIKIGFCFIIQHNLRFILKKSFKIYSFILDCAIVNTFLFIYWLFCCLTRLNDFTNFNKLCNCSKYNTCHISIITCIVTLLWCFIIKIIFIWWFKFKLNAVYEFFICNAFLIQILQFCFAEISCITRQNFSIIN